MIGFSNHSLTTSIVEQTVYRPMSYFWELDKNSDHVISPDELNSSSGISVSLSRQIPTLDLNGDGKIQKSEYIAGNYSNFLLQDQTNIQQYTIQEAQYPRLSDIVKKLDMEIMFFHGEWDNQTLLYGPQSVEIVNKSLWKKQNLSFHYIPKLGHALDYRTSIDEVFYSRIDKDALNLLTIELSVLLKP